MISCLTRQEPFLACGVLAKVCTSSSISSPTILRYGWCSSIITITHWVSITSAIIHQRPTFNFFSLRCLQIVNTTREAMSNCVVEASVFDVNGENTHSDIFRGLDISAKTTTTVGNIPLFTSINDQPMYFLLLKCLGSSGKLISRNFYWLHPVGGSYTQLAGEFRTHKIPITTSATSTVDGGSYDFNVQVANKNTSSAAAVAFGLYFTVVDADSEALEKRILPVTYSNNWFSLVPDEALSVQISFKVRNSNVRPKLVLRGWNVADTDVVPQAQN